MNYYTYKTIDDEGMIESGTIEGADIASVYDELSAKGLHVLNVKLSNRIIADISAKLKASYIKRTDIIGFANNLSVMLKAGVHPKDIWIKLAIWLKTGYITVPILTGIL